MSADGWREEIDFEPCAQCKMPLPKARDRFHRLGAMTLCALCFEMQDAISESDYMKKAQQEYRLEQQALKKLKPGEDYLQ